MDPRKAIAWCGSRLLTHSLYTAAIACKLFAKRWEWRARASGVASHALVITAIAHDIGKAEWGYQEAAAKACGTGGNPNFKYHEVLSALALAGALISSPESYVASVAALLHHHGMTHRYPKPLEKVLGRLVAGKKLGLKVGWEDRLGEAIEEVIDFLDYVLERVSCLEPCKPLLNSVEPRKLLENKEPHPQEAAATLLKGWREITNCHKLLAASTVLTGFIAISDSIAAFIEREQPITFEKLPMQGSYTARVLTEMAGPKVHELLLDIIELKRKIDACESTY